MNMDICHLEQWEKFILDHARSESCEGSKIRIPFDVAKEMRMVAESNEEYVEVDQTEYRKRIFEQGHVSNLIVIYAILGKDYDKVRTDLTSHLIDYVTETNPIFSDWKQTDWIEDLYSGKRASMRSLLPMIVKWMRYPYTNDDYKKFQYVLPLYLLLGDFKRMPDSKRELKMCMYDIVAGTNFIGDPTWQDVYYDISRSGKIFKSMVKHADNLFCCKDNHANKSIFDRLLGKSYETPTHVLEHVGNWLAFCAYITLVSKYQRYSLNAKGFSDAKVFISTEASRLFLKFREKLG